MLFLHKKNKDKDMREEMEDWRSNTRIDRKKDEVSEPRDLAAKKRDDDRNARAEESLFLIY